MFLCVYDVIETEMIKVMKDGRNIVERAGDWAVKIEGIFVRKPAWKTSEATWFKQS